METCPWSCRVPSSLEIRHFRVCCTTRHDSICAFESYTGSEINVRQRRLTASVIHYTAIHWYPCIGECATELISLSRARCLFHGRVIRTYTYIICTCIYIYMYIGIYLARTYYHGIYIGDQLRAILYLFLESHSSWESNGSGIGKSKMPYWWWSSSKQSIDFLWEWRMIIRNSSWNCCSFNILL